jgi:hypothetical protein
VKLLFSSQSAPDVGLLKNLLEDSGIATELRNEGVNAAFPGAAFQAEVWILNHRSELESRQTPSAVSLE